MDAITHSAVAGFAPSANSFRFTNSWPDVAAFRITVLGLQVPVGNAHRGLCGGMVFAARDYFEHGLDVPGDTTAPGSGPLYQYIGQRLLDSFDVPAGPAQYLRYMAARNGDSGLPLIGSLLRRKWRGIASLTIRDELPEVLADLDAGHLACLGLVCTSGIDPRDLGKNHQVLAYRSERAGNDVKVWVYDPNRPGRDDVYLQLSTAQPTKSTPIAFVNGSEDVRGFFRAEYARKQPPALS